MSIDLNKTVIGIELGSTRIKAVLIGEDFLPLASGGHDWENQLIDEVWTYSLEDVWGGIQAAYKSLADDVQSKFGVGLASVGGIGISAMMHGYLAFDKDGKLLTPFRTWRNTMTEQAAEELTELFGFNIPQRWSIAHLRQAMLNKEVHVAQIAQLTTLSGYLHYKLTGQKVLGIGDASGMFPIDSTAGDFDAAMAAKFNDMLKADGLSYTLGDIFPKVLRAGENAGTLTAEGAKLLDPTGALQSGIKLCPPEGDAGTGMVATNSVTQRTGNVSAGTSVFAMIVLEKPLSKCYPEIDMVTTPAGSAVAMVHCNNCTSELNDWADIFVAFAEKIGVTVKKGKALDAIFEAAMTADSDCGGLFACNYLSGEHITGFAEGRPLFARTPKSTFNFANFSRAQVCSAIVSLKIGMDILLKKENVRLEKLLGHGGYFKAKDAGQQIMAGAIGVPVAVMETAAEGGAWGMAVLASYAINKSGETLEDYLGEKVFANAPVKVAQPNDADAAGFDRFVEVYKAGLAIERAAVENLK